MLSRISARSISTFFRLFSNPFKFVFLVAALASAVSARAQSDDGGVNAAVSIAASNGPINFERQSRGRSIYFAPQQTPTATRVATGGPIAASVALTGNRVIAGTLDRWVRAWGPHGVVWSRRLDDSVFASPLVANGIAYIGSDDDFVRAYRVDDGKPLGTMRCGRCTPNVGLGPTASRCDVEGFALASDGTIYVAADGVYALGPDLAVRWHYGPVAPTQSGNPQRPVHCMSVPTIARDHTIYVGCDDDHVHALRPDGSLKWTFAAEADVGSGVIVTDDGTLVFANDEGKVFFVTPDGAQRAFTQLKNGVYAAPALGLDGNIYVATLDGALVAIGNDSSIRWVFRAFGRIVSAPLVDANGMVLFGANDQRLYALTPQGTLAWSVLLDGAVRASPLLAADGTIWIGTAAGSLYSIR